MSENCFENCSQEYQLKILHVSLKYTAFIDADGPIPTN